MAMEIGDWPSTARINDAYRALRALGLETNVAELEAFGFTVVPAELAGGPDLATLREDVLSVAEEVTGVPTSLDGPGDKGHYDAWPPTPEQFTLYFMALRRPSFTQWLMSPVLDAFASYLLGPDYRLSSQTAFVKWGEGYGEGLGLHADGPAGPNGELPHFALQCNVTRILTDYTKENGALAIVPGSHRFCRRPAPGEAVADAIPVEAAAGSVIVWHANTWHGAYPKTTPGLRVTLVNVLGRPNVKTQEDYRATLTPEVRSALPVRLVEILNGFDYLGWDERGPQYDTFAAMAREAAHAETSRIS